MCLLLLCVNEKKYEYLKISVFGLKDKMWWKSMKKLFMELFMNIKTRTDR